MTDRAKRTATRDRLGVRPLHAAVAAFAFAVGLLLAARYPLGGAVAATAFLGCAVFASLAPGAWLVGLPALLPVLALAPWSGWQAVEETDLLVLAIAAGGYARLAFRPAPGRDPAPALASLLLLLFAASLLVSMHRGVTDAGGWSMLASLGAYQGPHEPLASVRACKGFFAAALLWPLWRRAHADVPAGAAHRLSAGLAIGLVAAGLAALWERVAYTGLLNFSADYRTTALFWEMNFGGAALDGFLALTVPFALRELFAARSRRHWTLAAAALTLAGYICLTTFSRGVYMGVPVGLVVMTLLERRRRRLREPAAVFHDWRPGLVMALFFVAGAAWMFPSSGYRGVLALLGALAVLLPLGEALVRRHGTQHWAGLAVGGVLAAAGIGLSSLMHKGPYLVYAVSVAFSFAMLVWHRSAPARARPAALALAGYVWVVVAMGAVALNWGGSAALWRAMPVMALLLAGALGALALAAHRHASAWPASLRWQGGLLAVLVLLSGLLGVALGGAYMTGRFATLDGDLADRRAHWRESVALLTKPIEWSLGIGLARYPAHYALAAPVDKRPGDSRLLNDGDNGYLALASGRHVLGWGELYRVSQRIAAPAGPMKLRLAYRADSAVAVHIDVCEKHLLYSRECAGGGFSTEPSPGTVWKTVETPLTGPLPTRGLPYAPNLIALSIAVDTRGQRLDLDRIELIDASGRELLVNGDFTQGLAHWFATSDRYHLPWHAKNVGLHVLIEQGLLGALLLLALLAGALWRLGAGSARAHPLAPPMAGALCGFVVVGLTDSLLDASRIALLLHLLLWIALTLPGSRAADHATSVHA